MFIDLNSDLGESFGRYTLGDDTQVLPHITSANLACGFHAGDPMVMARTVRLAAEAGVAIGAHPGWPDLQGFGRREMNLAVDEVETLVLYQIGALAAFTQTAGVPLTHVKPHGALYNQAAEDLTVAVAIARATHQFDARLVLVGLAGSALITAGQAQGLRVANEGFPDRGYTADGRLLPRRAPGAVLTEAAQVADQAARLATQGLWLKGNQVRIDTLCLHGDQPNAPQLAQAVRARLHTLGFSLKSLAQ